MKTGVSSFLKMCGAACALLVVISANAQQKKLLVVTATQGFRHSSIPLAEKVIAGLGEQSGLFTVDYARGGKDGKDNMDINQKMTPEALKQYDGVIFANTTGDLPLPDKDAFMAWIKSGKAFIGMHSATDTFHGYRPYIDMIGGEFQTHGDQATVDCIVQDHHHPAVKHLGAKFTVHDEIYILKSFDRSKVHGLLTLDKHPNSRLPGDYPIAWNKQIGQGKLFYTSLGHREDVWLSGDYQKHILGGIKWALGIAEGEAKPQDTTAKLNESEQKDGFKLIFNGKNLDGWHVRNKDGAKSWSVQNGMLVNNPEGHGNDLVTDEKYRDFVVRYEFMVPKGSNSGFYLRGRHEIQIFDDFEKNKAELGGNGAIYQVKAVSDFVSRKPGEWQTAQATMKGNKVSLILNGVKVHDEVEVNKATGSELDANLDQPGAFFLQGDHGAVAFRNIRVKPLQ
ncbi:MAG: ThuA domain-containing protein [Verrucomicrobiales bacterium]